MKHGKKYRESLTKYDPSKVYDLAQACQLVKDLKFAKFDETVEVHVNLRLTKSQTVRDTLVFPHQFKGEKKVLVFCKEDRIKEALDAGAAYAGADEYIDKVKGGWLDFDVAVATPDMMKDVGRLGMVLGRKVVHIAVGKVSMDTDKLVENVNALLAEIIRKKPVDAKSGFVQSVSVNSTMGPGVWVNFKEGE